ncbi:MAG TPA: uroporphyrinogen decarboxylase family protein [Armatimonadota bacterium]|jgi:hypothetical protein
MTSLASTEVAATQSFIRDCFLSDRAPARPGLILHEYAPSEESPPTDPDPYRAKVLAEESSLRHRVRNGDDFVPMLNTNNGTSAMASAFGAGLQDTGGGHWAEQIIRRPEDIDKLEMPAVETARVGEALQHTRVAREMSDLPIRSLDTQSPLTVATQLMGVTELFMAMYDQPARVHALLELLTDFFIQVVEAQRAAAGDRFVPVYWPHLWAPGEVGLELADDYLLTLSPPLYEEFSLPCLVRLAEHFGGLFLHSCSLYREHLPLLAKIPDLRGVNCDLSMAAPVREILDALPGVVFAPHVYMNKEFSRPTQAVWLQENLEAWRPGDRLFPQVLAVMYDAESKGDLATDWEECRRVWREAGWELRG